jgi:hypothetical protein
VSGMTLGIGGHQSARMGSDEWLTPPHILKALGPFDLDPCAPIVRPWDTAAKHYTVEDDGLAQTWVGRVWLNPPYGQQTEAWMQRLAEHGNGIALIFARTETSIFFPWVWGRAKAVFFLRRRLHFHNVRGERAKANAGGPSALVAYGDLNTFALIKGAANGELPGKLVMV